MFQEKEIEAYQSIKAPIELKNRIRLSVEQEKRKASKQGWSYVAAAACVALVLLSGSFMGMGDGIVSVNDTRITRSSYQLENSNASELSIAKEGRSDSAKIQVPLEVEVSGKTYLEVSEGTLTTLVETDEFSEEVTQMYILDSTVVYWTVEGDALKQPKLVVKTEDKEYIYVITYNEKEDVFTIKQTK